MDKHAEVELLLEQLATALRWQPMEIPKLNDKGCYLFHWKPEDRARLLASLTDDDERGTRSLDLG